MSKVSVCSIIVVTIKEHTSLCSMLMSCNMGRGYSKNVNVAFEMVTLAALTERRMSFGDVLSKSSHQKQSPVENLSGKWAMRLAGLFEDSKSISAMPKTCTVPVFSGW